MTDRPTMRPAAQMAEPHRRLGLFALIALLAAGGAAVAYAATDKAAPASTDRAAMEEVVRDYILAHPEIIPEAIKRLQAKEMTQKIEDNRTALETPYKGSWEGAAKPDVTLVAFMDYACGYCRAALPDLARLVKEDAGLRIVYRELPIIAEGSAGAARVSMLAAEGDQYMTFHKAMYAAGDVEPATVLKVAGKVGLDAGKAQAALNSKAGDEAIMTNVRLAQAIDATGTPTFVVGNQVLTGAVGYEALKAAIAKARSKG